MWRNFAIVATASSVSFFLGNSYNEWRESFPFIYRIGKAATALVHSPQSSQQFESLSKEVSLEEPWSIFLNILKSLLGPTHQERKKLCDMVTLDSIICVSFYQINWNNFRYLWGFLFVIWPKNSNCALGDGTFIAWTNGIWCKCRSIKKPVSSRWVHSSLFSVIKRRLSGLNFPLSV